MPANTRTGNVLTASANGALTAVDGVTLVATDTLRNATTRRIWISMQPRRPPHPVRAVHVTFNAWADPSLRRGMLGLIDQGRINAVELDLKDESGTVKIRTTKMKDAELPPDMLLTLTGVALPGVFDEDGNAVTSAVLAMAGNLAMSAVAERTDACSDAASASGSDVCTATNASSSPPEFLQASSVAGSCQIASRIAATAIPGNVTVARSAVTSNAVNFTVLVPTQSPIDEVIATRKK